MKKTSDYFVKDEWLHNTFDWQAQNVLEFLKVIEYHGLKKTVPFFRGTWVFTNLIYICWEIDRTGATFW